MGAGAGQLPVRPLHRAYAAPDALAGAFGLSKSTLGQEGKQVRDLLKMTWATPEFLRAEMIDANPMIWFVEVNGLPYDARELPVEIQAEAYRRRVIPYVSPVDMRLGQLPPGGMQVGCDGVAEQAASGQFPVAAVSPLLALTPGGGDSGPASIQDGMRTR